MGLWAPCPFAGSSPPLRPGVKLLREALAPPVSAGPAVSLETGALAPGPGDRLGGQGLLHCSGAADPSQAVSLSIGGEDSPCSPKGGCDEAATEWVGKGLADGCSVTISVPSPSPWSITWACSFSTSPRLSRGLPHHGLGPHKGRVTGRLGSGATGEKEPARCHLLLHAQGQLLPTPACLAGHSPGGPQSHSGG